MKDQTPQHPDPTRRDHPQEEHGAGLASKLNWLRAGVLGANDGIVSTAGLVVGVAGATTNRSAILVAGLAGLVAGALSMAGGEYVSVSAQSDTEKAAIELERWELANLPEHELDELTAIYVGRGLTPDLAGRGGPAAHPARRPRRARRGRARDRPGGAHQPLPRGLVVDGRPSRSARCCRWSRSCSRRSRGGCR